MSETPKLEVIDGRRQRSARSREALIKASLDLIDQGLLVPTAKQIADKAGVGIRSFFAISKIWKRCLPPPMPMRATV